jgi:hypothetical protein
MKPVITCATAIVLVAALNFDRPAYTASTQQIIGPAQAPVILRSGFIPLDCGALAAAKSPNLVDCWLDDFPAVAKAMVWVEANGQNELRLAWKDWPEWRKSDLRNVYAAAVKWRDGGMTHWTGTAVDSVPANLEAAWATDGYTVLDEQTAAWPIYVAHLGFSMAAELHSWVPWSLRDETAQELDDLLRSNKGQMFEPIGPPFTHATGYSVTNNATPTHPTVTYRFLIDQHLLTSTQRGTIDNVLSWARTNLWHFNGPPTPDNQYSTWQYTGAPPVARVLSGTIAVNNQYGDDPNLHHYTEGCYATTAFLIWLLRAANIPVENEWSSTVTCGHTMPYFPSIHSYLSHGDDPYDQLSQGAPIDSLLVTEPVWNAWFNTGNATTSCNNVGREPLELAIWYLPDYLVGQYCTDVLNGLDHEHGAVYADYKNLYTVAQLEEDDLWTRLPSRVPTTKAWQCAPLQTP